MSDIKICLIKENHNGTRQGDVWFAKSGFDNEPSVLGCEAVYHLSASRLANDTMLTAHRRLIQQCSIGCQ